jgi:hypothetical protein
MSSEHSLTLRDIYSHRRSRSDNTTYTPPDPLPETAQISLPLPFASADETGQLSLLVSFTFAEDSAQLVLPLTFVSADEHAFYGAKHRYKMRLVTWLAGATKPATATSTSDH